MAMVTTMILIVIATVAVMAMVMMGEVHGDVGNTWK